MKLICLAGVLAGQEISLSPNGLTLGRGKDNDVVLTGDPQASRYHARLEYAEGGWHIRDRESANGVLLNGKRIQKTSPVADRDEITVGQCRFRLELAAASIPTAVSMPAPVADAQPVVVFKPVTAEEASPVAVAVPPAAPMPASLSALPAQQPAPLADAHSQKQKRIRLLIVGLVSIMLLIPVAHWLMKPAPGGRQAGAGAATGTGGGTRNTPGATVAPGTLEFKGLRVEYSQIRAGADSLFRYELTLRNGILSLAVDDPLNNRRVEDSRTLLPEQLKFMADNLLTEKVLQIQSPAAEGAQGRIERSRLMVACGNRGNCVVVENTQAPAALHEAEQILLDFAQALFGIGAEPMPLEEAMRQAEEDFANAHRMYEEYKVDPSNLYRAVKNYGLILVRLKNYETKPEWYGKCVAEEAAARKFLDDELAKRKRDAQTLITAGNLAEACQILAQIRDMVPNRDDHDIARWANGESVRLEIRMLQQNNRRR